MPYDPTLLQRITLRYDVFGGKPLIRDMRIPVELILSLLSQGLTPAEILDDYPELELADLHACLAYAQVILARYAPRAQGPAGPTQETAPPETAAALTPAVL